MTDPLIASDGLVKSYGSVRALDGLDLEVRPGPVGLLGPNGAGKTTLLKLLLGLLEPDAGRARIAGRDPFSSADRLELRRSIGYMPEGDCLIPGTTAVELVSTLGRLTGLSTEDAMTRAHEVLDYVGLEEQRYRPVDDYSTGMKQRVKLAQALVHDPELLLLDEPTNGLDPKGRVHMLDLVHDLGHVQGKSLLLCSHLLPDVERTCDSVVVVQRGRIVHTGEIAEMTRADERWLRIQVAWGPEVFAERLAASGRGLESDGDGAFRVRLEPGEEDADEVFALAHDAGVRISTVEPVRSSLEQVFLQALREADRA